MTVPELATERLRLRAHRAGDLPACAAMWADERVARYTIGTPSTRVQTWTRLLRYRGFWDVLGYGSWAVEEAATGRFVGELGFMENLREIEPSIEGLPEVGWAFAPEIHGKRYATEALAAVLAWGDANLAVPRTVCLISPDNTASRRLAERAGFGPLATTTMGGGEVLLLERRRPAESVVTHRRAP